MTFSRSEKSTRGAAECVSYGEQVNDIYSVTKRLHSMRRQRKPSRFMNETSPLNECDLCAQFRKFREQRAPFRLENELEINPLRRLLLSPSSARLCLRRGFRQIRLSLRASRNLFAPKFGAR